MFPAIVVTALFLNAGLLLWNCFPGVAHDNIYFHVPRFSYLSHALYHGWGIPRWYPFTANVPLFTDFISTFPFVPHRWIGYGLFSLTGDVLLAYRLMLLAGLSFAAWGWWLFLRDYFADTRTAWFGVLLFCAGGSGVTIFHQEQALVLIAPIPWFLLCLFRLKQSGWWAVPALVLLGVFTTTHYPHIFLLALGMFLAVRLVFHRAATVHALKAASPAALALGLPLALLAASPVYFLIRDIDQFVTVLRDSVKAESLSQYVALMDAPAGPHALIHSVIPFYGWAEDHYALYLGCTGLFFAFVAFRTQRGRVAPYAMLLLLFVWAFLGRDAWLPQILFSLRIPMIGSFRQYTHFIALVSLTLAFLSCAGFHHWSRSRSSQRILLVLCLLALECSAHTLLYRRKFLDRTDTAARFPTLAANAFLEALHLHRSDPQMGLGFISKPPLFRYRESQELYQRCRLTLDEVYYSETPLPPAADPGTCPFADPLLKGRLALTPAGFNIDVPHPTTGYLHVPVSQRLDWEIVAAGAKRMPTYQENGAILSIPLAGEQAPLSGRVGLGPWPTRLLCIQTALLLALFVLSCLVCGPKYRLRRWAIRLAAWPGGIPHRSAIHGGRKVKTLVSLKEIKNT